MKTTSIKKIFPLLIIICAVSLSCSHDEFSDLTKSVLIEKTGIITSTNQEIKTDVDETMLNKYLNLVKKKDRVVSIKPIKENDELLAYCVQYDEGWDLISADIRCSPVLASNTAGKINLSETEPGTIAALGMLNAVKQARQDKPQYINPIWSLFVKEKNSLDISKTKGGGATPKSMYGHGMWIAVDTSYSYSSTDSQHYISTQWGQDYPFNNYTEHHYPAGCVPVAVGQIIAHFRMTNPRNDSLYTTATSDPNNPGCYIYGNKSATAWNSINTNHYGTIAQIFVASLGKEELNANYTSNGTSCYTWNDAPVAFNNHKINFSRSQSISTLQNLMTYKSLIMISAKNSNDTVGHTFIADRYYTINEYINTRYEWDPEHEVTYWESQRLPAWMFEPMDDGKEPITEYETTELYTISDYIGMNWGWSGTANNNLYHFRTRGMPIEGYDEAGYYYLPSYDYYYNPNWNAGGHQYNTIKGFFYNFSELY